MCLIYGYNLEGYTLYLFDEVATWLWKKTFMVMEEIWERCLCVSLTRAVQTPQPRTQLTLLPLCPQRLLPRSTMRRQCPSVLARCPSTSSHEVSIFPPLLNSLPLVSFFCKNLIQSKSTLHLNVLNIVMEHFYKFNYKVHWSAWWNIRTN